jgi:hypothetical protein
MKITPKNLTEIYSTLDQSVLPAKLQQPNYKDIEGILEFYDDDDKIKECIDKFCEKLNAVVEKQNSLPSKKKEKDVIVVKSFDGKIYYELPVRSSKSEEEEKLK